MQSKTRPFVIPVFIPHAGCPHRCVFCDQTRLTGRSAMQPTEGQFHGLIERFLSYRRDPGRHTEIAFYGGNFLGLAPATIQILLTWAERYILRGDAQGIRFSTRPDSIDEEKLALLGEFPVTTIELGVQSMDAKLLRLCRRGHSVRQVVEAVDQIQQHPYRLGLQMMLGLPGETAEVALSTAKRIAALAPNFVRIYPTLILKGSPLESWYREGRFTPLTLDEAVARAKALYRIFHQHAIPVARMGLQATEELHSGAALVAGPFHPAFGELVHAALWRDLLQYAFERRDPAGRKAVIQLPARLWSRVKGHKDSNRQYLLRRFDMPGIDFEVEPDLPPDTIVINKERYKADFDLKSNF